MHPQTLHFNGIFRGTQMHHSLQFSDENKSLDESKYSTAASMIIVALLRIKRMLVAG